MGMMATEHGRRDRDYPNRPLLEFRETVMGNDASPMLAGAAVADVARRWGIVREADRARQLAVTQVAWLLANEHPEGGIDLYVRFEAGYRDLTVVIGDAGTVLPDLEPGSRWLSMLHGCVRAGAHAGAAGRELSCTVKVRPPWRVRLTWKSEELGGLGHPTYTYDSCDTRADALARARIYLRGLGTGAEFSALLAVHLQGPEQVRADDWELAQDTAREGPVRPERAVSAVVSGLSLALGEAGRSEVTGWSGGGAG